MTVVLLDTNVLVYAFDRAAPGKWACAFMNEVPDVFSEDFQDGQVIEGIRFVNPFVEDFQLEKWI